MTTNDFPYNYTDDPVDDITLSSDDWQLWLDYASTHTCIGPAAVVEVDHTDTRMAPLLDPRI